MPIAKTLTKLDLNMTPLGGKKENTYSYIIWCDNDLRSAILYDKFAQELKK